MKIKSKKTFRVSINSNFHLKTKLLREEYILILILQNLLVIFWQMKTVRIVNGF